MGTKRSLLLKHYRGPFEFTAGWNRGDEDAIRTIPVAANCLLRAAGTAERKASMLVQSIAATPNIVSSIKRDSVPS